MYKRVSAVLFPIVTVLLIGTAVWGYQENQEKHSILIKTENQYQRAFHNLSLHLDQLHDELGKALAVHADSHQFQRKSLINAWRITSEAQTEISQLPLTLMPFHKTEAFLASIANFTYHAALRDMNKQPITEQEWQALRKLYERSKEISAEIRGVQETVVARNLRWMDVEVALASEREQRDNAIIDGFKTVNQRVTQYDEVDFGPSAPELFRARGFDSVKGKQMTPDEIKEKARKFFAADGRVIKVTENGQGTEFNSYSVTVESDGDRTLQADFTKRGGQLIWFRDSRPVRARHLSIDEAADRAKQFLKKVGYGEMAAISADEYDNVASLVLARKVGDVTVYPEKATVMVALDNGEIIGMHANDLLHAKPNRDLPRPKLTAEQARARLNGQFEVLQQSLVLIENDLRKEVLCYEFLGKVNGSRYRVYINAEDGTEEQVERVREFEGEKRSGNKVPQKNMRDTMS
jgi:spore germination protein